MHDDFGAGSLLDAGVAADMVWMAMGVDDIDDLEPAGAAIVEDAVLVATGVDNGGVFGLFAGDNVTTDSHHTNGELFDKHRPDPLRLFPAASQGRLRED